MDINEFAPFAPTVTKVSSLSGDRIPDVAPLCLGNKISCAKLGSMDVSTVHDSNMYSVPTG